MNAPSERFDSIYPDLLRTGLGKLDHIDARRELLALFSALEHFRRDLHTQDTPEGILRISRQYIAGLDLFRMTGFWLVSAEDFGFESALITPDSEKDWLQGVLDAEIRDGRFAWALRQDSPVFFPAGEHPLGGKGMLHALAVSSQVVGMFCGILESELAPNQEIVFSLLSLLLGGSADALATLRKTNNLKSQINTLSGLVPVCSWCKKVRDDRGYWEQIEQYVTCRSDASFTHGICPDCKKSCLEQIG